MGQLLEYIVSVLQNVFLFIANIVTGLIQLIGMIPQAISFLTYSLGTLPPVVSVFAVGMISISVVYVIVGR